MPHDVFISYSSRDKAIADAVCVVLESDCIRCWIAPRDVPAAADWGESILEGIKGSRVMVLLLSTNANESRHVRLEAERAVSLGIAIVPLRVENVMPARSLELFITSSQWLDAFNPPLERHLRFLVQVIQKLLQGRAAKLEGGGARQPSVAKEVLAEVLLEATAAANEIKFHCAQCGQRLVVDKSAAGATIRCPNCGEPTLIPQPILRVQQKTSKPAGKVWIWAVLIGSMFLVSVASWWFGSRGRARATIFSNQAGADRFESERSAARDPSSGSFELARRPSLAFIGTLPGTIWLAKDSAGDRYCFQFLANGALNYETRRGFHSGAKWESDGINVNLTINQGYAKLSGKILGKRITGEGNSANGQSWTWEATPKE